MAFRNAALRCRLPLRRLAVGSGLALVGLGMLNGQGEAHSSPSPSSSWKSVKNVRCLSEETGTSSTVEHLLTKIRDEKSEQVTFVSYTDRLVRLVLETALASVKTNQVTVTTPTGVQVKGRDLDRPVAAISILRSGDAFMTTFSQLMPGSPTGKLLLVKHQVENPGEADFKILYSKMPKNLKDCNVFLMDPMLATGGTMILALRVLTAEYGVDPRKITVVSLISCPQGVSSVHKAFPGVNIITAAVDPGLDSNHFVSPGLGSFGDRYFGTH